MTCLEVSGVVVRLGEREVLAGVDLVVPAGAIVAVLGPSGCGKTTLLRAICGFTPLDAGRIRIGDEVVGEPGRGVPPERRGVGLVPQEGALFGHLDVAGNVGFGLARTADRDALIASALELVGLPGYQRRRPSELSGGQQQRVAVARALAPRPRLVLLDEPFSALDAGLRESVRAQVRSALRASGATALVVTHDQDEALSLADTVAVLDRGRILMHDTPQQVYAAPAALAVARFVGQCVELPATRQQGYVDTALGRLPCQPEHPSSAPDAPQTPRPAQPEAHRLAQPEADQLAQTVPQGGSGPDAHSAWQAGVAVLRPEQLLLLPATAREGLPAELVETSYYGHDAMARVAVAGVVVPVRLTGSIPPAGPVRLAVRGRARFFARAERPDAPEA